MSNPEFSDNLSFKKLRNSVKININKKMFNFSGINIKKSSITPKTGSTKYKTNFVQKHIL